VKYIGNSLTVSDCTKFELYFQNSSQYYGNTDETLTITPSGSQTYYLWSFYNYLGQLSSDGPKSYQVNYFCDTMEPYTWSRTMNSGAYNQTYSGTTWITTYGGRPAYSLYMNGQLLTSSTEAPPTTQYASDSIIFVANSTGGFSITSYNCVTYSLTINPDDYPDEISWSVFQLVNGQLVLQQAYSDLYDTFSACDGVTVIKVYDSFGDGICCAYGDGNVQLTGGYSSSNSNTQTFSGDYGSLLEINITSSGGIGTITSHTQISDASSTLVISRPYLMVPAIGLGLVLLATIYVWRQKRWLDKQPDEYFDPIGKRRSTIGFTGKTLQAAGNISMAASFAGAQA